jgi:FAD binding domain
MLRALGSSPAASRISRFLLCGDKRSTPSGLSRALVISTRGMELMRRFGLEQAIRSGAADVKIRAWVTPDLASGDGTEMPLGYPSDAEAALASPTRPAWVAQDHHQPVMWEHLHSLPSASVRLGCQLLGVTQDDSGVRATVADAGTGAVEGITASYLIAGDGAHSTVREQLGISMAGAGNLADYERIEFTAPLWPLPMRAPVSADADQVQGLHALAELRRGMVLEQHEGGPVPANQAGPDPPGRFRDGGETASLGNNSQVTRRRSCSGPDTQVPDPFPRQAPRRVLPERVINEQLAKRRKVIRGGGRQSFHR